MGAAANGAASMNGGSIATRASGTSASIPARSRAVRQMFTAACRIPSRTKACVSAQSPRLRRAEYEDSTVT